MKKNLFFIAVLILLPFIKLSAQCAQTSNIYTFSYGGHDYEVVKELKAWANAAACAVERGGYLVEINDLNEQNAVYNAIVIGAGVSTSYTSIANGGGIAYVWIGATDQQSEGTWKWDGNNDNVGLHFWTGQGANGAGNGAAVGGAYYNWGGKSTSTPQEPDNFGSGQHHGAIALAGWPSGSTMLGIAGEWNDIIGTSLLYCVIEKDNATGLQENGFIKNEHLWMYPNPTLGILNFNVEYRSIEIYDLAGRLLNQFKDANSINVSELEKGTYAIRLINDSSIKHGRFILN